VIRNAYDRIDDPADWLTVRAATARMLEACAALDAESVRLGDALHRVLAEPVVSRIDQPPWDNSAMDGFAARAEDVRGASADAPVALDVIEAVPAGGFPVRRIERGTAIRVMTGAPVPAGADSVIRVEHTRLDGERVLVVDAGDAGRNIRRRAEDVRAGSVVLPAGRRLRAAEIGVLAMIGAEHVLVHRRPRVAILSTGNELAPLDAFDEVIAGRRIIDSNGWSLGAAVRASDCEPVPLGIARDEAASLRARIAAAHDADALVTTAGASVGDHDLVKDVLVEGGYRLAFWRVRMRPGSPFSFGVLPRAGRAPLPVFGLPGNPVSALVTWLVLARPALRRLSGRARVHLRPIDVRAGEAIGSQRGLMHFLRARLVRAETGPPLVHLTGPQGSGMLTSMAAADVLLVVSEELAGLEPGDAAKALPLEGEAATDDFEL
jgi:molybdopterin molybdotransferase